MSGGKKNTAGIGTEKISKHKQAHKLLHKSEEYFHKIFNHSNDAIFVIDMAQGEILDVNPRACTMLGFSREELISMPMSNIHPNEISQLQAFTAQVLENGEGWTNELTCLTKSGHCLPSEISASVIDINGKKFIISIVRDITERKKAAAALHDSEQRLRNILISAMDAIITIDSNFNISFVNSAAEKILRSPAQEILKQNFDQFLSNKFHEFILQYMQGCKSDNKAVCHAWVPGGLTIICADGQPTEVEATISQVVVDDNRIYTIILRDINERKKAEARLHKLESEKTYLIEEIRETHNFEEIIGVSPAIQKVFQDIKSVAATDSTVIITGETGTGKELIARALHHRSSRKDQVLIKVNCAALPSGLLESEIFGHEKGAFTGALSRKIGRFELANGGSLFLDEIGDLSLELQAKFLRVLQESEFERVGGSETIKVDVRLITATNQDLEMAIKEGRFREDLFYRINVFPIYIPPLRERSEDITHLIRYFVMLHGKKLGKKIETISPETMDTLVAYHWPGNVRELSNIIERAVIISRENQLELGDWSQKTNGRHDKASILTLVELEKNHILEVLKMTKGRIYGEKGAAKILGLKPTTLESRMKKMGITAKT